MIFITLYHFLHALKTFFLTITTQIHLNMSFLAANNQIILALHTIEVQLHLLTTLLKFWLQLWLQFTYLLSILVGLIFIVLSSGKGKKVIEF